MDPLVTHVVGARPNFVKAAPVIRALQGWPIAQRLIHTGQHYDDRMSGVFFRELGLPTPDEHLGIGSGSHATQTGMAMVALERALESVRPAILVVYGDVNSTLAAALVAAKLGIPLAHVEAGLRSRDDTMPEEINRRVTDILSSLLFATAPDAVENLRAEGVPAERIHLVGNPLIDTLLSSLRRSGQPSAASLLGLEGPYAVATLHRPANVDDPAARQRLAAMLDAVGHRLPVIFPIHPRGRAALEGEGLGRSGRVRLVDPLGYLEFVSLVRGAAAVITDSGGVQEETTVLGIPCLTVRPNTERPITISHGTNRLLAAGDVPAAVEELLAGRWTPPAKRPPLWDGQAGERIARVIADGLGVHVPQGVRQGVHPTLQGSRASGRDGSTGGKQTVNAVPQP